MITLRSASRSRGDGRLRRLLTATALAATSIIAISAAGPAPVSANALDQGVVVNPDPVDNTPYAMNGRVYTFATVGNTVVVGGTFTTLRNAGNPTDISRPYLFSYNRNTGQINTAFTPVLDNWVDAIEISPDGQSVIVGGKFQNVNGTSRPSLAKISLSNGNLVGGFNANVAGRVRDLDVHGGKVYIGGDIWSVGGQQRSRMAAVDVNTGAVDSTFTVGTTLPRNTVDWVSKIDVRPNGDEAVIIGNFAEVDNQPRMQFAVIDLTGPTAVLSDYTAPSSRIRATRAHSGRTCVTSSTHPTASTWPSPRPAARSVSRSATPSPASNPTAAPGSSRPGSTGAAATHSQPWPSATPRSTSVATSGG